MTASPRNAPIIVAMFDELRRAGFVEGQNLTIDWRTYGTNSDLIPELTADLVKARVDVIYTAGDPAIRTAQGATKTIPILGVTEDMVAAGLVQSLARPGGNTTGVSILATELDGKRQDILIDVVLGTSPHGGPCRSQYRLATHTGSERARRARAASSFQFIRRREPRRF